MRGNEQGNMLPERERLWKLHGTWWYQSGLDCVFEHPNTLTLPRSRSHDCFWLRSA